MPRPKGGQYNQEQIERSLFMVAMCAGNTSKAADRLREEFPDEQHPTAGTLNHWIQGLHAERYGEIVRDHQTELDSQQLAAYESLIDRKARLEARILDRLEAEIEQIPARELPGALRNATTSKGIDFDKASAIRGRPTVIVQNQSLEEIMAKIAAANPSLIVDGSAEEITPELAFQNDEHPT